MFNKNQNLVLKSCMSLALAFAMNQAVFAENSSEVISFHNKTPDSNELLNAFLKKDSQSNGAVENITRNTSSQPQVRYRGISIKKKQPASANYNLPQNINETSSSQACMAGSQSVAVSINFASNSKKINRADTHLLQNIAQAMNSPQLSNCYFVVEGHTDAKGNDYYNLWLSQQRAQEVKNQLDGYNAIGRRLVVVGKGESQLFDNNKPYAAENRRVVFRVINAVN